MNMMVMIINQSTLALFFCFIFSQNWFPPLFTTFERALTIGAKLALSELPTCKTISTN